MGFFYKGKGRRGGEEVGPEEDDQMEGWKDFITVISGNVVLVKLFSTGLMNTLIAPGIEL